MQTFKPLMIAGVTTLLLAGCAGPQHDPADREATRQALSEAAEGEHRSEANRARNQYRNPVQTLDFFGLETDMTVVELWPGSGWYTEILAPVLADNGKLVAASFDTESSVEYQARIGKAYLEKLAAEPGIYGDVEVVAFDPPRKSRLGEPGSADMVVTFRNLHGWINDGVSEEVFRAALEVLKPGGRLGFVQHRAPAGSDPETWAPRGYVPEDHVVQLAESVGFRLANSSEINANPADDANHQYGVWTLPPSFRACREITDADRKAACEAEFREIGESDRMTLLFIKPE